MPNLDLLLTGLIDPVARENFERLSVYGAEAVVGHFQGRFLEIVTAAAVTAQRQPHHLPFVPKDVITTRQDGGTVTWIYASFDRDDIVFTTSAAMTIRAFVGLYQE